MSSKSLITSGVMTSLYIASDVAVIHFFSIAEKKSATNKTAPN